MVERIVDFSTMPARYEPYQQPKIETTNNEAKLLYMPDIGRMILVSKFEDKDIAKQVPGASWKKQWKAWSYPLEYQSILEVKKRFLNLVIADNLEKWMFKVEQRKADLLNLKHLQDIPIDVPNADRLYPFQRVGVNYAVNAKRAIIADDMGLGKTFESLLALEVLGCQKCLIIAPKKVNKGWGKEINKWIPHRGFTIIKGDKKKKMKAISEYCTDYLIVTYEFAAMNIDVLSEMDWDAIVIDEAHRIKNRKSKRTIAIKQLNDIPISFLLTGTPVLNDMNKASGELWSLLNFLFPDKFSSYWRFIDQFCEYEDGKVVRLRNEDEFKAMLAPVLIRRLKKDVLPDLPSKHYKTVFVELYPAEKRVLKELEDGMMTKLSNGEYVVAPLVITQITRMRQACISAKLLSETLEDSHEEAKSAKIDAIIDEIKEFEPTRKIVIFSQFAKALVLLSQRLIKEGIQYAEISGNVTDRQAERGQERFMTDPACQILLATIQAAAEGLDGLQEVSDIEMFIDQYWVPKINEQAEGRLDRIGQKNNTLVIKFIVEDSFEERIEEMLQNKRNVFEEWIEGAASLSAGEFMHIISGNSL